MALLDEYVRILDAGIMCPICSKSDWCLVHKKGYKAICSRRESKHARGDAGWLHFLKVPVNVPDVADRPPRETPDFDRLHAIFRTNITEADLRDLSRGLNVSQLAADRLGAGMVVRSVEGPTFTFPLWGYDQEIVGIQCRYPDGTKKMITGSKVGLLVPAGFNYLSPVFWVCEGASDTMAAITLRLNALGRLSANQGREQIKDLAFGRKVFIIADNDAPGVSGAVNLRNHIEPVAKAVRVVYPSDKYKDLRQQLLWEPPMKVLKYVTDQSEKDKPDPSYGVC